MSAQVQIKISPTSYDVTVAVLKDRKVGLERELKESKAHSTEWKGIAKAIVNIEDVLNDLEAPVHG